MTRSEAKDYAIDRRFLWGVAPVAPIHFGLDPLLVALRAAVGQRVIVIADSQVTLQRRITSEEAVARTAYYRSYMLHCSDLSPSIIETSSFVTDPAYVELLYELLANVPSGGVRRVIPAAAKCNVVSEKLMTQVSLVMQCADALYLKADTVIADSSQRRIYSLLEQVLPELKPAKPPQFVYAPSPCDIRGAHIFDSSSATRISIHDDADEVSRKVARMYAPPAGQPLEAGRMHALHQYFQWSVFPWRNHAVSFLATDGRLVEASAFEEYLELYAGGRIHPAECKRALSEALNERVASISKRIDHSTCNWIRKPHVLDSAHRSASTKGRRYG